ncbi:MAG: hypothetical protein GY832_41420 [Chloroflexi bacterium]|nr:hypothetical protein [Chloroflexota bacterium]
MTITKAQNRPGGTGERLYKQLPDEIASSPSKREVLFNVLGPLLVVFTINLIVLGYLSRYPTNRGYWLMKRKWEILQTMPAPADWLILGDSSGNQGMIPEKLQDELGGTAVNLCTIGDIALFDDVWMLEEHIEKFGPPKNVIIVHAYDVWPRQAITVLFAKIPRPWGYWREFTPAPKLSTRDHVNIFLARYMPLYAENATLLKVLHWATHSPQKLFKDRYHLEPGGYMKLMRANPRYVESDTREQIKFVENRKSGFSLSDINQTSLEQIIALSEQYHINVFIANSPIYEGLYENKDFQAYFSKVQMELDRFAEQSEYIHYLSTPFTFPINQMQNTDHVIHSAAEEYTEMLALEIAQTR